MNTLQLSNGLTILAKDKPIRKWDTESITPEPLRYGNRTMAEKKVTSFGPNPYEYVWQVTADTGVSYGSEDNSKPLLAGFYVVVGIVERTEEEQHDADYRVVFGNSPDLYDGSLAIMELKTITPDLKPTADKYLARQHKSLVPKMTSSLQRLGGVLQDVDRRFHEFSKSFHRRPPFATVSGSRHNPRNRHNHQNSDQTDRPYTYAT